MSDLVYVKVNEGAKTHFHQLILIILETCQTYNINGRYNIDNHFGNE